MKTIKFPPDHAEQFKDYLKASLSQNDEKGYSIEEVRVLVKVFDTIEDSNANLELEDAHYAMVKNRIAAVRWRVVNPDIVHFVDCIEAAA